MKYPVTAIFKSIQGEGHFVGYPATFIRLAGCSVASCSIRAQCDEAPWKAQGFMEATDIARTVWEKNPGGIAVITGGEPTDHNLVPLVDLLRSYCMRVHLETSGVRKVEGIPLEWITVSPKTPNYEQRLGHTLKVVVRPEWGWDEVLKIDLGTTFFHRYLQPLTQPDGSSNLQQVVEMVKSGHNPGGRWALSTQAHRTWGVQ